MFKCQRDATVDLTEVVNAVDRCLSAVETDRAVVSAVSVVATEPVNVSLPRRHCHTSHEHFDFRLLSILGD